MHKIQRGRGKRVVCTLFTVPWEAECIHVFMYHTRMWLLTAYRCIRIQIQIQIGSLHTRLDETDEMTNTALLEGGKRLFVMLFLSVA